MRVNLYPFGSGTESGDQPAVASHIAGPFEGWAGRTVFRLRNGQVWQQTSPGYLYRYAYMPRVLILPSLNGYRMKVEGISRTIPVKRLR